MILSEKDIDRILEILNADWQGTMGANTDSPTVQFGWEDSPNLKEIFQAYEIPIEKGHKIFNSYCHGDDMMMYEPDSAQGMKDTWDYFYIDDISTVHEGPFIELSKWANQSGFDIKLLVEIRKDGDFANGYASIREAKIDADSEHRGSVVSKRAGIVESFLDYDQFFESIEEIEEFHQLNEGFKDVLQKVQDAIRKKDVCNIYYKGEINSSVLPGTRYIEPYAVGVSRDGNMIVRAWLIKGVSKTGKIDPRLVPGWRLFKVNRIQKLDPTHQKFTSARKGYNPEDEHMKKIISVAKF